MTSSVPRQQTPVDDDDSDKIEVSSDCSSSVNGDLTCATSEKFAPVYPPLETGQHHQSKLSADESPTIWSKARRAMQPKDRDNFLSPSSRPVEELYSVVRRRSGGPAVHNLRYGSGWSGTKAAQRMDIAVCVLFDILLMILELAVQATLANQLIEAASPFGGMSDDSESSRGSDLETFGSLILAFLFLPSICNALLWVGSLVRSARLIEERGDQSHVVGTWFMACLALFSLPSPLLVYVWFLYLAIFDVKSPKLASCRSLMAIFRLVHAVTCSVPVMLINLYTLVDVAKVRPDGTDITLVTAETPNNIQAMDVGAFLRHMEQVDLHGLCFAISMISALRAATVFNERLTWSVLYTMVSVPFHLFSLLARLAALALIVAFLDWQWIGLLFVSIFVTNVVLVLVCRKPNATIHHRQTTRRASYLVQKRPHHRHTARPVVVGDRETSYETMHIMSPNFAESSTVSANSYPGSSGGHPAHQWVRYILFAACSVVIPAGYSNDAACFHPPVKGGLYLMLNYFFNMAWIGLALGLTILNYIPNVIHGVSLPNPSVKVQVPDSRILVKSGVLDLNLALPSAELDLGSMAPMAASVDTANYDAEHATVVALILALIVLPFVTMRAAFMELECFVFRRKHRYFFDHLLSQPTSDGRSDGHEAGIGRLESSTRKSVHARVFVALCCSTVAMVLFTMMTIVLCLVVLSIHA